ncbi:hypothetical protein LCGC14_2673570 [marine sediment metagenome]|uniref:Uncharacterized protein n=1 Tax=marine sediment metagenome TaxID=412755 RepID=A0A0F9CFE8_9ZZZZ
MTIEHTNGNWIVVSAYGLHSCDVEERTGTGDRLRFEMPNRERAIQLADALAKLIDSDVTWCTFGPNA